MDLPSAREVELEILLRQRDAQVAELTDDISRLRQYLSTQPSPSTSDPITLPPALISILLPHINNASSSMASRGTSATVTAALTQRAKLLQEENDELYGLLKFGETGQLKEEVRALRRVVNRLEGALRDSHSAITNLSTELDKSYETFMSAQQPKLKNTNLKSYSSSTRPSHAPSTHSTNGTLNANAKPPPTGPRAHKKARLSESRLSPPHTTASLAGSSTRSQTQPSTRDSTVRSSTNDRPVDRSRAGHGKLDVDESARENKKRVRSPFDKDGDRDKDRDREGGRVRTRDSDRDRERVRDKERERARDRDRRNGHHGSSAGSGVDAAGGDARKGFAVSNASGDRTLAERMGL